MSVVLFTDFPFWTNGERGLNGRKAKNTLG